MGFEAAHTAMYMFTSAPLAAGAVSCHSTLLSRVSFHSPLSRSLPVPSPPIQSLLPSVPMSCRPLRSALQAEVESVRLEAARVTEEAELTAMRLATTKGRFKDTKARLQERVVLLEAQLTAATARSPGGLHDLELEQLERRRPSHSEALRAMQAEHQQEVRCGRDACLKPL